MSLIRKHVAVLQAWACLALVIIFGIHTAQYRACTMSVVIPCGLLVRSRTHV